VLKHVARVRSSQTRATQIQRANIRPKSTH
jgi:hypothetical protein